MPIHFYTFSIINIARYTSLLFFLNLQSCYFLLFLHYIYLLKKLDSPRTNTGKSGRILLNKSYLIWKNNYQKKLYNTIKYH